MIYSVNILAHNEEKTITECINSILNQGLNSNDDLQVNIISNGCSDNTETIVKKISSRDERISLFSIIEGGKVNALRTFLQSAGYANFKNSNEIVFFMDADVQLNDPNTLMRLAEKLLSDEALYAISASCIPESVYNKKRDFVSCLFRVQADLHRKFQPNILRGMLYCIRTDVLQRVSFPDNLLADDICLEICLDGHFKTDYQSPITYSLHHGIQRELRRDFMHCLGVLQAYLFLREKKIRRLDPSTARDIYRFKYFCKSDIVSSMLKTFDLTSLFFLLIHYAYHKFTGLKARRLINRYGTDGMDYRSYWKTRH